MSPGAKRRLNELLELAEMNAFAGSMRPDDADEVRETFAQARMNFEHFITTLERQADEGSRLKFPDTTGQ